MKSNCCDAPVEGGQGTIKDYICLECKEHCQTYEDISKEEPNNAPSRKSSKGIHKVK